MLTCVNSIILVLITEMCIHFRIFCEYFNKNHKLLDFKRFFTDILSSFWMKKGSSWGC